jgi:uncharacterized protein (TIGR02217 family)
MAFHNVRFPTEISLGSEGGPLIRSQITTLASGYERRNSPWSGARRRYNAGYGVKSLADIEAVLQFFEARHGRLYSFRWRDPLDYKSCPLSQGPTENDQVIGDGDGIATDFQLVKSTTGSAQPPRPITKPVTGSVLIALDGVLLSASDYSVDDVTGFVSFLTAPASGVVISAGFLFDTPVRFDMDQLSISLAALGAGDIPSIPLIEVLE